MSVATDIYDFFTPVENAISAAYERAGVTCYTPLGLQQLNAAQEAAPDNAQQFQRKRPRLEIVLHPGAARGFFVPQAGRRVAAGHLREKANQATLSMDVITEPDIVKHRAFLARILFLSDTLAYDATQTETLTNHYLQAIKRTSGDTSYEAEDGHFRTRLTFDVDLSVQENKWPELEAELES